MRWDLVYEGETLTDLSVRLGVPACMIMRANQIYSEAWLLPGRAAGQAAWAYVSVGSEMPWSGLQVKAMVMA